MAGPVCYSIVDAPITSHVFNKDKLIICPNTNEAQIYQRGNQGWNLESTLKGHDMVITSVDVARNSNRIVTCSQDRNAYVWTLENGVWKPMLVLLRINRAATCVRWSPNEDKFAVASGARCVAVCYFDEDNNWWASKHLSDPIRSTVLSVDWHPNNVLVAAGSTDMKARVFSSYIKSIDKKPPPSVWGEKLPFKTLCGEFTSGLGGWVHAVAFSPSGDSLAFCCHDASVNIAYPRPEGGHAVYTVITPSLPFRTLIWANERQIVAAGFSCAPMLFETNDNTTWQLAGSLDSERRQMSSAASVLSRFKSMDTRGQAEQDTDLATTHQNTISEVRVFEQSPNGGISQFSTCGLDGKVVIWDFDPSKLASGMQNLNVS